MAKRLIGMNVKFSFLSYYELYWSTYSLILCVHTTAKELGLGGAPSHGLISQRGRIQSSIAIHTLIDKAYAAH